MRVERVRGELSGEQQVVRTYRYLRLSLVLLALMLTVSVVLTSVHTGVVLDSISEYYYSSSRGVLVASLVAIGVGLVAQRGKNEAEDVALNLAGMFAPVVAFVPTPRGRPRDFTVESIDNNMTALLVAGAVAVVGAGLLALTALDRQGGRRAMSRAQSWGLPLAALVVAGAALWLRLWRDGFVAYAHYTAAIGMFVCIALAVLVNARVAAHLRRSYTVVFALMLASQLAWLSAPFWSHAVLLVEALLIGLFAVFWSVQTWELRYPDA